MQYPTVAVTGANGYVGSHITALLLRRGYRVQATVLENRADLVSHIRALPGADERLRLFEANLLEEGSFDAAFAACDAVFHVASPFSYRTRDGLTELIEPAEKGTINVLRSCARATTPGVRKVVLTSSVAAIETHAAVTKGRSYVHTEADWNDMSTERFLPYECSKLRAERAAWDFVEGRGGETEAPAKFKLVAVNPALIFGPPVPGATGLPLSESISVILDTVHGRFFGLLDLHFPVVDVRDVATAHVAALENGRANGRYICSAYDAGKLANIRDVIYVAKEFGFRPPERDLTAPWTTTLVKAISYVFPGGQLGQVTRNTLGAFFNLSNRKIVAELGVQFRPVDQTIRDTLSSLIELGHLQPPRSSKTTDIDTGYRTYIERIFLAFALVLLALIYYTFVDT